jgi:hypothetical protein
MATEPKQPQSDQDPTERKSQEAERDESNKASNAKEGMPGYGQPDDGVREKKLPEQDWQPRR